MAATPELAEQTVRDFVRSAKSIDDLALDTPLYADGVGLDSLETAELSATLEDALGTDPYSADEMPQTLAEIVAFYARSAASA